VTSEKKKRKVTAWYDHHLKWDRKFQPDFVKNSNKGLERADIMTLEEGTSPL